MSDAPPRPSSTGPSDALARALGVLAAAGDDPLRLDLPPDDTGIDAFPPDAAALFGALYLAAQVDQTGLLHVAEALAERRNDLPLADAAAAEAVERFARSRRDWYGPDLRDALWSRLFGVGPVAAQGDAAANAAFGELLAGWCDALLGAGDVPPDRAAAIRMAGAAGRLRANLAPRRFGNTAFAARHVGDELRAAIDVLGRRSVAAMFGVVGVWQVVRAAYGDQAPDIGRLVDQGRHGQVVLAGLAPRVPGGEVAAELVVAAAGWLGASGFPAPVGAGLHRPLVAR